MKKRILSGVVAIFVLLLGATTQTAAAVSFVENPLAVVDDPRCENAHFDLPHRMKVGERYDGYFYITNNTSETVWYDIVFETNLGSYGPISAHLMGLPGVERSVGFAIYEVDPRNRGAIRATVTVEGDTEPCVVYYHWVRVDNSR